MKLSLSNMLPPRHFLVGICLSAVCFSVSRCSADDWPHWMGPGMDGVWHESGTIDQFPEAGPGVLDDALNAMMATPTREIICVDLRKSSHP
jgi:hypothetical protein